MSLKNFEDTLKNIENDKMLMSYGENQNVINNILSVVNLVQTLETVIRSDRSPDSFTINISNKVMELGQIVVAYGNQRLMEKGISAGANRGQQFNPFMAGNPMFSQQMYYPSMMQQFSQQPQMQQQPIQQQYTQHSMMQQPMNISMPQTQQQQPVQTSMAASQNVQQSELPTQPKVEEPVKNTESEIKSVEKPKSEEKSTSKSAGFSLPGLDGGAPEGKALGRDYLIKLLEEK